MLEVSLEDLEVPLPYTRSSYMAAVMLEVIKQASEDGYRIKVVEIDSYYMSLLSAEQIYPLTQAVKKSGSTLLEVVLNRQNPIPKLITIRVDQGT
jgi:hypothetical protein